MKPPKSVLPDRQAAAESQLLTACPLDSAPPWVAPVIRRTIWRVVAVGLGMAVLVLSLLKARGLVGMLVMAVFFGIAMDPAVTYLHARRGWRRGVATGAVLAVVVGSFVLLVTVLIPGMIEVAGQIHQKLPGWIDSIERTFGVSLGGRQAGSDAGAHLESTIRDWVKDNARSVLGLAGTTVGLVFQFFTVAMFTFYFAADAPRIRRAVLIRVPDRQQRLGSAWDTAIQQTGGYFYSRLLLMLVNGGLFFFVMLAVGVPWLLALPLAIFEGFVAEFIPAVGTYIGAAVPIVVTFGVQGLWQALVLVGWTVLYQMLENYWLSPRLSAKTMEINGGVAFGAALAGGAIAGPMGAFMALPVAALVTSFLTHFSRRYPLTYHSAYDGDARDGADVLDAAEPADAGPHAGPVDAAAPPAAAPPAAAPVVVREPV